LPSVTRESDSEATPALAGGRPTIYVLVALGASAGGLAAIREFFSALQRCSGMSMVIVVHQQANRRSLLPEILGRWSSYPVASISNGTQLEPDHVYVAPPGMSVTLERNVFRLQPLVDLKQRVSCIDRFFSSAADSFGAHSVGIVLSGAGSDGSTGIRAIADAGGLTIAQDPQTAVHSSMPHSAIATGAVELILPPAQIAAELVARFGSRVSQPLRAR
jgi:two-component system CheB/CheR fusion protein